ncbi:hypothetical protein CRE_00003 [Caenorhabditis remanei]|uniref:Uncharacterized protein n=1 Tax=Caenorhabditis remanei TaxID=31234 RepID=E3LC93_CAERE|nr:hypothetical protein CRE_00003 [Caenorhabditis remanei]
MPVYVEPQKHQQRNDGPEVSGAAPTGNFENHQTSMMVRQSYDHLPQINSDPMQNPASNMPIEYYTGVPVVQQPFEPTKRLQYASETVYYDVDSQMKKLGRPVNTACHPQQENFPTPAPTPSDCSGFTGPLRFQYNVRLAGDPQMVYQAQPVYQKNFGPVQPQYSQAPQQQYVANQSQFQTTQTPQQQFDAGPTQPEYFQSSQQQCNGGQVNPQIIQTHQQQLVAGQAQPQYSPSTQKQYVATSQPHLQSFQAPQQHYDSVATQVNCSQAPQQQFHAGQVHPQVAQVCQQQYVAAETQLQNCQALQQLLNTGPVDTRFIQAPSQHYVAQNQVQYSNTPQEPCIPGANQPQFVAGPPQQQYVAGPTQSQSQVLKEHINAGQSNSLVVQAQQQQSTLEQAQAHYNRQAQQYVAGQNYPQIIHILHPHPITEPPQPQYSQDSRYRGHAEQANPQVVRPHQQQFVATKAPAQYYQTTQHQCSVQSQALYSESPKTRNISGPDHPQLSQQHENHSRRSNAVPQQCNAVEMRYQNTRIPLQRYHLELNQPSCSQAAKQHHVARQNQPLRAQDAQKPSVTDSTQPQNYQAPQQQIFLRPNQPQHPQVQQNQQQYMVAQNQAQYTQSLEQQCSQTSQQQYVGVPAQVQNSHLPSQQMCTPSSVEQLQLTSSMDPQWNSGPQYAVFNVPIQGTMSFRMLWQPNSAIQSKPQSQPQLQNEMQPQLHSQPQLKPQDKSKTEQQAQPKPSKSQVPHQPQALQTGNSEEQILNLKPIPLQKQQQEVKDKIPEKTTSNDNLQERKIEKNLEENTSGNKIDLKFNPSYNKTLLLAGKINCTTKAVGVQTLNESTSSHDVNVTKLPMPKKNEPSKKQVNAATETERYKQNDNLKEKFCFLFFRAAEETPILSNGTMTFATEQSPKSYSSIVAKPCTTSRRILNSPSSARTSKLSYSTKMLKLGDYLVDSNLNSKKIEQRNISARTKLIVANKSSVIHELLTTPKLSNNENDVGLEISQQINDCKSRDWHQPEISKSVSDDDSFRVPKKVAKPVIIRKKKHIDLENEGNTKTCDNKEEFAKNDLDVVQPGTPTALQPAISEQVSSKENINPDDEKEYAEDKKVVEEEEFDLNAEKKELEEFKDIISGHCSAYNEAMTHARHGFKSFQLRDRVSKPDFGEIGERIFSFFEANSLANMIFSSKKVETKKFASKKASFYGTSGNLTNQKLKIFYERIEKVIEEEKESHRFIEDILFLMSDCGRRNLDELYMKMVLEFPGRFANCKRIMPLTLESFENIKTELDKKYLNYFIGYMNHQFTFRSFSPPVEQMNGLPPHEKLLIEKFKVSWHSAGVDFDELAKKYFETKRSQLMANRRSPQNECFIKFYTFLLEISSSIFSFDVSFRKCCEHPKADRTAFFLFDDISFFKLYFGYEA